MARRRSGRRSGPDHDGRAASGGGRHGGPGRATRSATGRFRGGAGGGPNIRAAGEDLRRGDVCCPGTHPARRPGLLTSIGVAELSRARPGSPSLPPAASWSCPRAAAARPDPQLQLVHRVGSGACGRRRAGHARHRRDDRDETSRLIPAHSTRTSVVTSGGVSVGDYDFVKAVQDDLACSGASGACAPSRASPCLWRLDGRLVFGVPGNPVAAMTSFEIFVRPALLAMQGRAAIWRPWRRGDAGRTAAALKDRPELRRCVLEDVTATSRLGDRAAGLGHPALDGDGRRSVAAGRRFAGAGRGRGSTSCCLKARH